VFVIIISCLLLLNIKSFESKIEISIVIKYDWVLDSASKRRYTTQLSPVTWDIRLILIVQRIKTRTIYI